MIAAVPGLEFAGSYALGLLFVGLAVVAAIGALSHEEDRAFSASIIYLGLGVVAAAGIEVLDIAWVDPIADHALYEKAAELAVIVALFGTGLKLDRELRWRGWQTVARLLGIAMPLTIAAVALFGTQVMGLSLGAAIILGATLAPTDPVLAGDIGVGPPGDEEEREPNFAITGEAGLNDGLAFPFVLLGIVVAGDRPGGWFAEWVLTDVLYAIVVGVAMGAVVGYGLGATAVRLRDRHLLSSELDGWLAIPAVLVLYGATEVLSGLGFVAAFVGGVAFRRYEHGHEYNRRVHDGAETVEKFGELAVILLLGSMLSLHGLGAPGWAGWGLALLVVFVLRPATVNLALLGSRLQRPGERAFLAWFGVRGVGTLFYVAAATGLGALSGEEARVITWTAVAVVILSVVLHGITAGPLSRWLSLNVLDPR